MSNYEATKYDFNAANLTGIEGIPTATIIPWSTASVPSGFLECNGSAVSRTTYAGLFAIIGTTYGAGDGSSTFNVPDLQNNVPVGKSNNKSVGSTGGANTVTKSGNVSASTGNASLSIPQLASHTHPQGVSYNTGTPQTNNFVTNPFPRGQGPSTFNNTGSGGAHSHNVSANFSGNATSVVQPYLTVIFIIKT